MATADAGYYVLTMPDTISRGDQLPSDLLDKAAEAHLAFERASELYKKLLVERKNAWTEAFRGGHTLAAIAERSRVSPPRVHRVVVGKKTPPLPDL